tara:strand:+ start:623 stop:1228 length:606 start_codon:yes stop_codon:yes gene_type:complete
MTKFVFKSNSADKKPGKGVNEELSTGENYKDLEKIKDWRRKLSNMYISPFILGGKEYISVENFFHSVKFSNDYPEFADTFAMDGNKDWSKDPFKSKQAGKQGRVNKLGKKYYNAKLPELKSYKDVKMRDDFYDGIDDIAMTLGLYSKFTQNKELEQLLLNTGSAELYHLVIERGKKGNKLERWHHLERIRYCIQYKKHVIF